MEDSSRIRTYLVLFCVWLLLLHLGGLYLFTRGFLLTRLVLNNKSQCSETPLWNSTNDLYLYPWKGTAADLQERDQITTDNCWYPKQFKRAVIIIIDALRFDFAASHSDLDVDHSHYLNKLPIFHELLNSQPYHSLLLQYVADAPTTTLQRLKALTTGTLPTFIDAGSNFAGSSIDEDNLIDQLSKQEKKIAFMGDDTWVSLFPDKFETNMTHPFPSFNVWDLHTVDDGILNLLDPIIKKENYHEDSSFSGTYWDVLIAHFLGVDHCGHRYGPDHPAMSEKLNQMDKMIRNVVNSVDEDTIVLVMGDHGMDSKGDHGGDSDNEVESALFVYSKKQLTIDEGIMKHLHRMLQKVDDIDSNEQKSFTTDFGKWRRIPQIDFVPTLSLLLGLPIPFNSLGSIIPELFLFNSKDKDNNSSIEQKLWNLLNVIRLNARQVYQYTLEYSQQQQSAELSKEAHVLKDLFEQAENQYSLLRKSASSDDLENLTVQYMSFMRITLSICRRIWAQFDLSLIISGISILIASCFSILFHIFMGKYETTNQISSMYILIGGSIAILSLLLHTLSFASNSYTVFEDRISVGLLQTVGVYILFKAFSIRDVQLRKRLIRFTFMSLITIRIAAYSTICREEQIPYCIMTFYASSANSLSSPKILLCLVALSALIPFVIRRVLFTTKSFNGIAPFWTDVALRAGLMLSAAYWVMDNSNNNLQTETKSTSKDTIYNSDLIINESLKWFKNFLVRIAFGIATLIGHIAWWTNPLCLDLQMNNLNENSNNLAESSKKKNKAKAKQSEVEILGFSNAYGASYFVFLTIIYLLLVITQKPMGGLMLSIALCQIMLLLEIVDIKRKAEDPQKSNIKEDISNVTFLEIVIFSLCGTVFFFSTGHQATISSIQWSVGFIGINEANFTITPILITLNSLSSQILFTCAIPLLVFWNKSPLKFSNSIYYSLTKTILYYILYNSIIATSTTIWAAWFRRHLMVWKVFAPRFMLGGISLLCIDFVICFIVITYACTKVIKEVSRVFNIVYK